MKSEQFRNLLAYAPTTLIPALVGIMVYPLLTHWFVPKVYGQYALVLTTLTLVSNFSSGWVTNSALRYFRPGTSGWRRFFSYGLLSGALTGLVAGSISFPFIAGNRALVRLFVPALVFLVLYTPYRTLNMLDRVEDRKGRYSFWDSSLNAGKFLLGLAVIHLSGRRMGLESIFWSGDLVMVVGILALWIRRRGNPLQAGSEVPPLSRLLAYGIPLSFTLVAAWIFNMSDNYILSIYQDMDSVGIYATVNGLVDKTLRMIPTAIMLSAWPRLVSEFNQDGWNQALRLQHRQVRFYLLLMIPMLFLFFILAPWVFRLVIGKAYWSGTVALFPLALGVFFSGLNQYYVALFNLAEKSTWVVFLILGGGLIKLAFSFLAVPNYGFLGAAWATCSAFFILFAVTLILTRRRFGVWFPWWKPRKEQQ